MTNINENCAASLKILQLAIIGCRDACIGRIVRLAAAECQLTKAVRSSLASDQAEHEVVTREAINEYGRCDYPEVPERCLMYKHLLSVCHGGPKPETALGESPNSSALLRVLDLGISRMSLALNNEDLEWAEIEADHIHNIPPMLGEISVSQLTYYLTKERSYFESRLAVRSDLKHHKRGRDTLVVSWSILDEQVSSWIRTS